MSIDPRIWGSRAWFFMYCVALTYPHNPSLDDKINTKSFFESIGKVLPCEKCRHNFAHHLEKFPLVPKELSNRKVLTEWLIKINNEVNKLTNGPNITYKGIIDKYSIELDPSNLDKQSTQKTKLTNSRNNIPNSISIGTYLGIIIPIILIIFLLLNRNQIKNKFYS